MTDPSRDVEDLETAAAELKELTDAVLDAERSLRRAVLLAGRVDGSGVCEKVEGMPLDLWLTNVARLIGTDRHRLIDASTILAAMPHLAQAYAEGHVSWGEVRTITAAVSQARLSVEQQALVDRRIGAAASTHGLVAYPPDELVAAIDAAITETRHETGPRRAVVRSRRSNYLAIQGEFDGGCRFWGRADVTGTAMLTTALNAARHHTPGTDPNSPEALRREMESDVDSDDGRMLAGGDDDLDLDWPEASDRSRSNWRGLEVLCNSWMSGTNGGRARALFLVHVQAGRMHPTIGGRIETDLPGLLPALEPALADLLARDADVRAVVFDGARPLAVSAKVNAAQVPADTRLAVRARDLGDRFLRVGPPGISERDPPHRLPRPGGDHHPDNLITLGVTRHRPLIHRRGWHQALDPDTGTYTIARAGRTFRSLPHGTPLPPDPGPDQPPRWSSGPDRGPHDSGPTPHPRAGPGP